MPPTEPGWSAGLLDDAVALDPTPPELGPAVHAHREVRRGEHGSLVGALCVTEAQLTHVDAVELPLHLAVTGGAGSLEAALRWVAGPGADRVSLGRVSARLRGDADLARNARRVVTVLDSVGPPDGVEVYAAPPEPFGLSPAWLAALDELAAREVGLLLPAAAPWTPAAVDAALDRELPLSFTASSSAEVVAALVAVRTALDGEPPPEGWLADDPDLALRTRRWCVAVLVPDLAATAAGLGR